MRPPKGVTWILRKLAFLQREPLARFGVAFLLTIGVTLPLLLALDLSSYVPLSLSLSLVLIALLTVLNTSKKSRRLMWIGIGATALVQFFLPGMGLFGSWLEAFKALALYFSSYTVALPLFGAQVASLLTVLSAVLSYVFAKRGVGFLPAALIVVLMMFGLWSLGKGELFWYVAPALVALLLQMSQAAHEKINILHVLPMAAVTVLLAFLLLPGSKLVIDPLAKAATSLKQMISDYLFFTEPRNVFTLGTYGYYPMGNGQLGGAAEPSEFPVMMVKTDQSLLLRAVTKDEYTGRSFLDTSSAKRYLYINPRWQTQRRKAFLEGMPTEAIQKASTLFDEKAISVQMQNRTASTVFSPLFLRSLKMENDMVPYFNDASELFITRDMQQGDRYTVFTPVIQGGQSGLDALVNASPKDDAYYQDIYNAYTQLPSHMEKKVFDDVANIVKNETTPYGKATAILRHLQKYYRYTLTPETPPDNLDFVTYFLYVGKEGYCTYYASAMTVMCRMANLPARYVEGFLAQPSGDGFAYVTGKDAHAWTEVYFEGFGWVPFDPTPIQQGSTSTPPEGNDNPEPSPSPSPEPDDQPTSTPDPNQPEDQPSPSPEPSNEPDEQPDEAPPDETPPDDTPNDFPWAIVLVAAALAALITRIVLRKPEQVAKRMPAEKDKIFVYGSAVQHMLMYAKRVPKNGETPLTFAKRVDSVHVFPTPITPLWRMLALSNYSRMELTAEQTKRARETFQQVFKGSHALRRLRFLLAAAFDPRFYRVLDTPAPHDGSPKGPTMKLHKSAAQAKGKNAAYAPKAAGDAKHTQGKQDGQATPSPDKGVTPKGNEPAIENASVDGRRNRAGAITPDGANSQGVSVPPPKTTQQAAPINANRIRQVGTPAISGMQDNLAGDARAARPTPTLSKEVSPVSDLHTTKAVPSPVGKPVSTTAMRPDSSTVGKPAEVTASRHATGLTSAPKSGDTRGVQPQAGRQPQANMPSANRNAPPRRDDRKGGKPHR